MPTTGLRTLPLALSALLLTLVLAACSDDDTSGPADAEETTDPVVAQAEALAECTTAAGLDGEVTETSDGVPAVDLTTVDQTIIVHLLPDVEEAEGYENAAGLDQEVVDNAVVIGGAISAENRTIIVDCLQSG